MINYYLLTHKYLSFSSTNFIKCVCALKFGLLAVEQRKNVFSTDFRSFLKFFSLSFLLIMMIKRIIIIIII